MGRKSSGASSMELGKEQAKRFSSFQAEILAWPLSTRNNPSSAATWAAIQAAVFQLLHSLRNSRVSYFPSGDDCESSWTPQSLIFACTNSITADGSSRQRK